MCYGRWRATCAGVAPHEDSGEGLDVEVRILGHLEVEVGGRQVRVGPQQRVVLAVLLLEAGHLVPRSRLIELLWGQPAPEGAATTLRSHIRHLRQALEPGRAAGAQPAVLVAAGTGEAAGYVLRIDPAQVDAVQFERLVAEGRKALDDGDPSGAAERLRTALALWRGPALADVADRPFATREAARLEGMRRTAQQTVIEAELALGRHAELITELEGLVAERPHDEGLRRQLALALYRSHRQEDAARVCREGLELLHDRGLDSPALQALQRDILRQAPELQAAVPERTRPFQLPPDIAEFTGRGAELAALRARLVSTAERPGAAIVISAIDGKPGIGKSALAVHVAHELAPQFPDGVLYVNLRGAEPERLAPAQVLGQFLRALGTTAEKVPGDLEAASAAYRTLLADKRMLVVLDNAADAGQVRPLLPGSPRCAVIVTSRAPLADLEGTAPLSLGLPDEDEAVALFARIGGRRRVDAERAEAVAVVRHCGLLPLAVRIAGARLRARPAWPVAALAARLADERRRLGELRVGELAVRASFQLSYQSLNGTEARTFRLLGLLEGPDVTAEAAAALTGSTVREAESVLERLVDAQLLETPAPDRYRFHDLLRLFARERAEAEDDEQERDAAVERALRWFLATALEADELLKPTALRADGDGQRFADRQAALDWLETELGNLVAAAVQAAARAPAPIGSVAWRLSETLFRFFYLRKHWSDWQVVCEAALRAARRAGDRPAEAEPLTSLGVIFYELRRYDEAIAYYEESLAIYREWGDVEQESRVLNNLGNVCFSQRRFDEAIGFYEQSLTIARAQHDLIGEGRVLNNLGMTYQEQRRFDEAIGCLTQSLAIWREIGERHREGMALVNLGDAYREDGRLEEAAICYRKALKISREVGDRYGEGLTLWALGLTVEATHGVYQARRHWTKAFDILASLGAPQAEEVRALLENPTTLRPVQHEWRGGC
jgi:DNA-binding SARP family transcriptional activator/tetratricopeptide (TPR) repeat protein